MTIFLSIQGSMAVGKTTALKYLAANNAEIQVSFEDNRQVIAEMKHRHLGNDTFADYLEKQRLFIGNELQRYQQVGEVKACVMDFGSEEILFYTLNYPKSQGLAWPVAEQLAPELTQLKQILPKRILYLRASEATLRKRKNADFGRDRGFFETYLAKLLPLKEAWFMNCENVDVLEVDHLSADEVGRAVNEWVNKQIS